MKNIVPLSFTAPIPFVPILKEVVVDHKIALFPTIASAFRAAAPKLMIYFGERLCNFV